MKYHPTKIPPYKLSAATFSVKKHNPLRQAHHARLLYRDLDSNTIGGGPIIPVYLTYKQPSSSKRETSHVKRCTGKPMTLK